MDYNSIHREWVILSFHEVAYAHYQVRWSLDSSFILLYISAYSYYDDKHSNSSFSHYSDVGALGAHHCDVGALGAHHLMEVVMNASNLHIIVCSNSLICAPTDKLLKYYH